MVKCQVPEFTCCIFPGGISAAVEPGGNLDFIFNHSAFAMPGIGITTIADNSFREIVFLFPGDSEIICSTLTEPSAWLVFLKKRFSIVVSRFSLIRDNRFFCKQFNGAISHNIHRHYAKRHTIFYAGMSVFIMPVPLQMIVSFPIIGSTKAETVLSFAIMLSWISFNKCRRPAG